MDKNDESKERPVEENVKSSVSAQAVFKFDIDRTALNEALSAYTEGIRQSGLTLDGKTKLTGMDKQKGFVAEVHHEKSFNIDAAARRIPANELRAELTPYGTQQADIRLIGSRGGEQAQLKFGTPEYSASELSRIGVDGQPVYPDQKIVASDQLEKVKDISRRRMLKNSGSRPGVSNSYGHTASRASDILSDPTTGTASDPLSLKDARDMASATAKGDEVQYSKTSQRQRELFGRSAVSAAKVGFIAGTATACVGEIVRLCRSGQALTEEQIAEAARNILLQGVDGGLRAVTLVSAERFLAQGASSLLRSSAVVVGANVLYDFSKGLYKFVNGQISGDELLADTLGNTLQTAGVVGGTIAGSSLASAIGIGASIGTPLGPLGVVIGGTVGGLIVGLGVNKIVGSAQQEGRDRLRADLEELTRHYGSAPSTYKYIDTIGSMAEYQFSFKHLIPCYGTLGVLSEYGARRKALEKVEEQLESTRAKAQSEFREGLVALEREHRRVCRELEFQFTLYREKQTQDAQAYLTELSGEVAAFVKSQAIAAMVANRPMIGAIQEVQMRSFSVYESVIELEGTYEVVSDLRRQAELIPDTEDRKSILLSLQRILDNAVYKDNTPPIRRAKEFFGIGGA